MKLEDYTLINWKKPIIRKKLRIESLRVLILSLNGLSPIEGSKNLIAIDDKENIIWIADLPTNTHDSYYDIKFKENKLFAWSSNSFLAEIDPKTGSIIKSQMVW